MLDLMRRARGATGPNPSRIAEALNAPERGPRLLFFSGGSALAPTSRALKRYTHNSRHLVTPFDSGGSSASLREAFRMLSVGDLRNRLIALADESKPCAEAIRRFFAHRFAREAPRTRLASTLDELVEGQHPLIASVPEPVRSLARAQLEAVREAAPPEFDWRGASIGNLVLAGGYLRHERDITVVLEALEEVLTVRGEVRPVVTGDLHLVATLEDGRLVVGQHRITGNGAPPPDARIRSISLVRALDDPRPAEALAAPWVASWIAEAELICFPVGSFFTSVVANLLPRGVGRAIADASCPKVYVPNAGNDAEMRGMSVADAVEVLLSVLRADAGDTPAERLLDAVLLDERSESYARPVDEERILALGVRVLRAPLLLPKGPTVNAERLSEALVSLAEPRTERTHAFDVERRARTA